MTAIFGRIIRIADKQTFVINLGKEDGISDTSIFRVYAKPEPIIDPETKEELGNVIIVKARMKSTQVFDKFTIATSQWKEFKSTYTMNTGPSFSKLFGESYEAGEEDLPIKKEDIQPWKARTEEYVQVGDTVEVKIPDQVKNETEEDSVATDKAEEDVD